MCSRLIISLNVLHANEYSWTVWMVTYLLKFDWRLGLYATVAFSDITVEILTLKSQNRKEKFSSHCGGNFPKVFPRWWPNCHRPKAQLPSLHNATPCVLFPFAKKTFRKIDRNATKSKLPLRPLRQSATTYKKLIRRWDSERSSIIWF